MNITQVMTIFVAMLLALTPAFAEDAGEAVSSETEEIEEVEDTEDIEYEEPEDIRVQTNLPNPSDMPRPAPTQPISNVEGGYVAGFNAGDATQGIASARAVLAENQEVASAYRQAKEEFAQATAKVREEPTLENFQEVCEAYTEGQLARLDELYTKAVERELNSAERIESYISFVQEQQELCASATDVEEVKEHLRELRDRHAEERDDVRVALHDRTINKLQMGIDRLSESFTKTLDRAQNAQVDTSDIQEVLAEGQEVLEEAQVALDNAESANNEQDFETANEYIRETRELIVEAGESLRETINAGRELAKEVREANREERQVERDGAIAERAEQRDEAVAGRQANVQAIEQQRAEARQAQQAIRRGIPVQDSEVVEDATEVEEISEE